MLFRFTLNNTIEGSHLISDPDGWKEIKLKLERDKEYHSLVEMVELPLIFYRSSDLVDGGYAYIRNIEDTQGIDAQIEILIEVSEDQGATYETFFNGLLEMETIKDISDAEFYKLECNIVRNDFWSKFFSRKSQQVNLGGTESLDGETLTQIDNIELQLPSQKIRGVHDSLMNVGFFIEEFEPSAGQYIQYDNDQTNLDEVLTKYNLFPALSPTVPVSIFDMLYDGVYIFDIKIEISNILELVPGTVTKGTGGVNFYFQINDNAVITMTETINGAGPSLSTTHRYSATHTLVKGDQIRIYAELTPGPYLGTEGFLLWGQNNLTYYKTGDHDFGTAPSGAVKPSYFLVTGDTTYPYTTTESFLLRDAAESILSKIISRDNVLFSDYLGDETPQACAANFAIMKGLHVRGYAMIDKPMFMSFDDWWEGANPIFNLGLGYEVINGTEYIRIEKKDYFYDDSPIMTLSNIEKITRTYDKDKIFKSIEIGYQKWAAESASGVDDPQTKKKYNTRFKIIGKDESILSKFVAASLAIEQTRRNRIEFGKDWRLDEDTIIIALSNDSSPYQPELDEAFTDIVNLLNSDTRYNIRLTPARNFERWKPYFNGCLQTYVNNSPCEYYKFASGEGNYDTVTTGQDTCDEGRLGEKDDICVTTDFYHGPGMYEFEHPMDFQDYKVLRDNRNRAIEVSETTTNHRVAKIEVHEYDHFNATGSFKVWIKE